MVALRWLHSRQGDYERKSDATLMVWDIDRGAVRTSLRGHSSAVTAAALGHRARSASRDKIVRIWDIERGEEVAPFGRMLPCGAVHFHLTELQLWVEMRMAMCTSCAVNAPCRSAGRPTGHRCGLRRRGEAASCLHPTAHCLNLAARTATRSRVLPALAHAVRNQSGRNLTARAPPDSLIFLGSSRKRTLRTILANQLESCLV